MSVSSITDNGHKVVHEKKNLCLKRKKNSRLQEKENFSFCPQSQKKITTLLTDVGVKWNQALAQCMGHLNYRDFKNLLTMNLELHDEKRETCSSAKTTKTHVQKQN